MSKTKSPMPILPMKGGNVIVDKIKNYDLPIKILRRNFAVNRA